MKYAIVIEHPDDIDYASIEHLCGDLNNLLRENGYVLYARPLSEVIAA